MVADIEGFGDPSRTGPHLQAVRNGLDAVMQAAFAAAGVPWDDCYREMRGDAVVVLTPVDTDKTAFVETALPALVTRLRVHNDTHPEPQRLRLRVALHAGEVSYDTHGISSAALIRTFRLCDAPPLKAALAASPGVLAVIASDGLFDDVIRHTPAAAPATWHPAAVTVKEADTTGWITLPDHPYPSGPTLPGRSRRGAGHPRSGSGWGGVVPRQLPAAVRDFTGRTEHLAALDALIPLDPSHDGLTGQTARSVVITVIDGAGGIGKTTLALHWARRTQDRFPDGTLYVNLRGYGPGTPTTASEALGGFLRALGVPPRAIPADLDEQAALLRSLLTGKRLLVVLDNAYNAEQIRPLLPGTPGCMVLVTSRDSLTGLVVTDAARRLPLDVLSPSEAFDLTASILGADCVAAEPDAVDELIRLCARLPLALRIAASRAAGLPHQAVTDVVAELADDHTRLEVLSETEDERAAVRAVFDWSYQRLPPAQARLFRRLGLHLGPDLSLPAVAALAELSPADTRPLLSALAAAHLIEYVGGSRYRFHDLLRTYAADQAHRHDSPGDRLRAVESLLTWYRHTVRTADLLLYPTAVQLPAVVAEPNYPYPLAGPDEAWSWLTTERTTILAALRYGAENHLDNHVLPLADACNFLLSAGSPQEWIDTLSLGITAARRTGNLALTAHLLISRGEAGTLLGRWEHVEADLDRAETVAQQLNDATVQPTVVNARGLLFLRQGRFEEALRWFHLVLSLSHRNDAHGWEAGVEGSLSEAYTGLGDYPLALEHGERSLRLHRQFGSLTGQAWALTRLARARHGLHDLEGAIALCREAIAIGRRTPRNHLITLGGPLEVLATCLHQLGRTSEAAICWEEAATVYDIGYPHKADEVRQRLRDAQLHSRTPHA
ncbi:tetratricopeptide repeat protein [Amycolatopsis sp., V23-08]|uniref:Tetratricopeptide repeat protein n=1 Tax=Amycolatopsis heterodermiae TaxID=3110235 RepID=A0ABU5RLI7_9PSEU|nr:tetratricopeptide repeat protein [Amycolatopsis sp., V23-08]MEA5367156.1 tetratricopeptide repeat protein [Amycolatopsis sp., V23-08]